VLGGKVITGDASGGVAFKLAMAKNRTGATNLDTWMRCITETFEFLCVVKNQ
jgi:hypothetical protein